MKSLKQITSRPVVGNAMSDAKLLEELDAFIMSSENSMTDRALALDFMSHDVMGETDEPAATEADVLCYVDEFESAVTVGYADSTKRENNHATS